MDDKLALSQMSNKGKECDLMETEVIVKQTERKQFSSKGRPKSKGVFIKRRSRVKSNAHELVDIEVIQSDKLNNMGFDDWPQQATKSP